ncbi:MAG: biopolymer transporter ExbD [candidate division KSB1 bacterium]|nr:biopolymer transporter ExbD [candidate division KSB1 bacterium]MDZ7302055.1 biopolymer transporter ExbD [candidate division KSB1 bacterium]MDZ7311097.1 biopolymer transporter ExbD [candidate division KSB1 bacterium]
MKSKLLETDAGLTEINLTSLIDISLVLVVIFLVMTPMILQSTITVSTPKVSNAVAGAPQTDLRAEVYLTQTGEILVNGVPITPAMLTDSLRVLLSMTKNKLVVISADEQVVHDRVVAALDAARQAGAKELSIVKRRRSPQ